MRRAVLQRLRLSKHVTHKAGASRPAGGCRMTVLTVNCDTAWNIFLTAVPPACSELRLCELYAPVVLWNMAVLLHGQDEDGKLSVAVRVSNRPAEVNGTVVLA